MNITEQQQGAITVLRPDGPLAGTDADAIKSRLLQAVKDSLCRVILDASGVSLVDSKGLEALVDVSVEMAQSGHTLKLCAANPTIRQVLELTGLSSRFEHFEDANSAVRSFL